MSEAVANQIPVPEPDALIGADGFPPQLDNVNLNALFWGGLWALVYRDIPWFLTFVVVKIAVTFFFGWFNVNAGLWRYPLLAVPASAASELLSWGLLAYFAFHANRRLWQREQDRPSSLGQRPVSSYLKTQHDFALAGFAFALISWLMTAVRLNSGASFSWPGALAGLAVEASIITACYLIYRQRAAQGHGADI